MSLEQKKITIGNLIKIVSAVSFIIGWTITIYAWVTSIDHKVDILEQRYRLTHDVLTKQLQETEARTIQSEKAIQDLSRTIDKANLLLERLDKKLQNP